jgi:hypothetical protein
VPKPTVGEVFAAFSNGGEETPTREPAYYPDIHAEVDALIGERLPDENTAAVREIAKKIAAHVLRQVFAFIAEGVVFDKPNAMSKLMPRACAALWVLSDEENLKTTDAKRVSLSMLSEALAKVGIKSGKCWLSTLAEDMTNRFGFVSRNQKSRTSRANYAEATRKSWEKRRKKKVKRK